MEVGIEESCQFSLHNDVTIKISKKEHVTDYFFRIYFAANSPSPVELNPYLLPYVA